MQAVVDKLLRNPNFLEDISGEQWDSWRQRLAKSRSVSDSIARIASYLVLEWPHTRRHEKIGDYLRYSLSDVIKIKGLGKNKIRTLIACIAYAASLQPVIRYKKLTGKGIEKVAGNTNTTQPCFLDRTLMDLFILSDEERELLWTLIEETRIVNLGLPDGDWGRLCHYGIYQDDMLDTLLPLSIEYIYEIWPDHYFNKIVGLVSALMQNFLQRQVFFDDLEIYSNDLLFPSAQMTALNDLSISPTFVPENMVSRLAEYGIARWEQMSQLSERAIVRQYGFNMKSVNLMLLLRAIRPDADKIISKMLLISTTVEHYASFESIITKWVLNRTKKRRDAEVVIKRMGWGMEPPQTLEEIGQNYQLTRERVRQVIGKFDRSANKSRFTSDCYPLWILIDSFVYSSGGISSMRELAEKLQSFFNLQHRPHFAGLVNLLRLVPSKILRLDVLNEEMGLICSQSFICRDCDTGSAFLVHLVSEVEEILVYDVVNEINSYCDEHCSKRHKGHFRFGESFVDFLVSQVKGVRENILRKEDKLYHVDKWNLLYGRLIAVAETILKITGRAMHFTEIYNEIKKIRPGDDSLMERNVHATLDRSSNVYLWDRGTFIHRDYVTPPLKLLVEIERWIITELKSSLPYMSVNKVFRNFQSACTSVDIPTETALYSCLREHACQKLLFPQYPQIHLSKPETKKISNSIIFDEFLKDAGGTVTYGDIKEFLLNGIGLKEFQMQQLIFNNPSILRLSPENYIHVANLNFDMETSKEFFEGIIAYALKLASRMSHISVEKIFSDKQIDCKVIGIHDPEMLYSIFRFFASDKLALPRYPQIFLPGADEVVKAGISKHVMEYILMKDDFCTISELEDYFVGKLGYDQQTIWGVRYKDGIYNYLKGAVIHREAIQWSDAKQEQLEVIAMGVYNDFYRAGRYYGLIDQILELDDLPPLNNDINYTQLLLADLLISNKNFILLGNTKNAYVPSVNCHDIRSLQDLVLLLLKSKFGGAANLQEFEGWLLDDGIIQKRLTTAMLGDCAKVTITGMEIMMTELINHA